MVPSRSAARGGTSASAGSSTSSSSRRSPPPPRAPPRELVDHAADELRETVEDLIAAVGRFQEAYGVPDPDAIDPDAFTGADHDDVYGLWEDVTGWRTIRREVELLQRAAHRADASEADDPVSA